MGSSNDSKAATSIKDMFRKGEKSKENKSIIQSPKKDKLTDVGCGFKMTKPLPDVFTEAKIHISDGVNDAKKLKRYLIAYGGIFVEDFQLSEATHIIFPDDCHKIN